MKSNLNDPWQRVVAEADALKDADNVSDTFRVLSSAYDGGCRHPEVLWRLGRAHYDVAKETTDKKIVEQRCREGLRLVDTSLQSNDESSGAHKWKGILLSCVGDFIPTREKIANTYVIRDHFQKAVQLNDHDSTSHHCLAQWCFAMSQISWIERQAANLLFGAPPQCSLQQCRDSLLKSDGIDKTIHNQLLLGDVALKLGDKEDARKWFSSAAQLPARTEQQRRQKLEAEEKLQKL